jgi:hypothetical protein
MITDTLMQRGREFIRLIRAIRGENGSEDWPQKTRGVTKKETEVEPLIGTSGAHFETWKDGLQTVLAELHEDGLVQEVSAENHPVADHPEAFTTGWRLRMIILERGRFIGRADGKGRCFRPAATDSTSRSCKYRHNADTSCLNSAEMASLIM